MNRSTRRELAFKLIYSLEIQKDNPEEIIQIFLENNVNASNETKEYIKNISNGIITNKEIIEEKIIKNLKKDWSISRISKIDLAILKIAIYEIEYNELPFKVAINEAVELAKKYSESQSPAFINGILANIIKEN